MYFQHVYDKSLAQASYFIGCQKEGVAIVIDPKRDVDTYIEIARQNKMKITHVAETHIHADFLSGSRELAALTGAEMYLSDEGGEGWLYEFPHVGLKDGTIFKVGNLKFEVLHTPGHTPESITFLLTDVPASNKPVMMFTGDFVFVGDVGRPDLLEEAAGIKGTKEVGAKQMFKSVERFRQLAEYIQVWPGHGAGSACGKALGAVPSTTVGYEKVRNWALQHENDEPGFVKYLLEDQPEPPKYFAMMKKLNKVDRKLMTEVPALKKLSKADFKAAMDKGIKVIDTRMKTDFAKGFIPGTINIQGNNAFATWMGWFLSYDEPFILIADEATHDDLTRKLMRIGLDNIYGYVPGVEVWEQLGNKLEKASVISLDEFKDILKTNHTQVVDLRGAAEYKTGHIKGTDNVFIGTLEKNLDKIKKDQQVIIHCQSGDRSSIGYSILAKNGFKNVKNYSGGMGEWANAGEPVVTDN
ncbi:MULTISPECIES: MBL fold metallo-hydrolase [unclassified Imperialibacter]|uniref:MBL fold metallo-hydrolase n=1 Tax=unclassified Imperialibacter TaxID=2629706 RepID=UPI0012562D9A|nr:MULTISPECIES: MBL fold metallo-hydrolase [unclassified Imperialibacter]CAD5264900.1 Zn-dependent hydrolase [Imperialibacter sp. 89]CAD5269769.1 Zn-dependent hydrolase [Imperialibacter sp. 75]VVT09386.1 Beta-lactamase [Imperialibacter sp. EC-SDR9]